MNKKLICVVAVIAATLIMSAGLSAQEGGSMTFMPALLKEAAKIGDRLAGEFEEGTRILFCTAANEAADSVNFAVKQVMEPVEALWRENHPALTFIDGDIARRELNIKADAYLGQEEAKVQAQKIGADLILTCRIDKEGRFVFDGYGDASIHAETTFTVDETFFRLWTGLKIPQAPPAPVPGPRMTGDVIDAAYDSTGQMVFLCTTAHTAGALSAVPPYRILWEIPVGEPVYAVAEAGKDAVIGTVSGLRLLDGSNGSKVWNIPLGPVYSLAVLSNGSIIAGTDRGAVIVNALSGEVEKTGFFKGLNGRVHKLKINRAETMLAVGTDSGVSLYEIRTGNQTCGALGGRNLKDFHFANRSARLFVLENDFAVYGYDGRKAGPAKTGDETDSDKKSAAGLVLTGTANDVYLLVADKENLWGLERSTLIPVHLLSSRGASFIKTSPDGSMYISGGGSPSVFFHQAIREPEATIQIKSNAQIPAVITIDALKQESVIIDPGALKLITMPIGDVSISFDRQNEDLFFNRRERTVSRTLTEGQKLEITLDPDTSPRPLADNKDLLAPVVLTVGSGGAVISFTAGERPSSGPREAAAQIINNRGLLITLSDKGAAHQQGIVDTAISPNGAFFATASQEGLGKIWNAAGNLVRPIEHNKIKRIDVRDDGTVVSSDSSVTRIWKNKEVIERPGSEAVFLGRDKILVLDRNGKTFHIMDDAGNRSAEVPTGRDYLVSGVKRCGTHIVVSYRDRTIEIRNQNLDIVISRVAGNAAVSGDGGTAAFADHEGITYISFTGDEPVEGFIPHQDVHCLGLNHNGTKILAVDGEKLAAIDIATFKTEWQHRLYKDNTFLTIAGRFYRGSVPDLTGVHLKFIRGNEVRDYTGADEELQLADKTGVIAGAIAGFFDGGKQ
jgi:WD40 repeat protein